MWLMSWYNASPTAMGQTPLEGFVMAKYELLQGYMKFDVGCDLVKYGNKVQTTMGIQL